MSTVRLLLAAAVLVAAGLALAACSPDLADQTGLQPAPPGGGVGTTDTFAVPSGGTVRLVASTVEGLGPVLTDQDGRTLYRYAKDSHQPSVSTCDGACAAMWPPLTSASPALVSGVAEELVSSVTRNDGTKQVTVDGWPVYRYVRDTGSGTAQGQGIAGNWAAITPDGGKATGTADGQNQNQNVSGSNQETQGPLISTMEIDGLGTVLTDQNGMTLYLFTHDSHKPSVSTCDGACTKTWPPVAATGTTRVAGLDPKLLGRIRRDDGSFQVTVGGWPVYTYTGDTAPGQAGGHGVGGTWFALEPNGCRIDPGKSPIEQAGEMAGTY